MMGNRYDIRQRMLDRLWNAKVTMTTGPTVANYPLQIGANLEELPISLTGRTGAAVNPN